MQRVSPFPLITGLAIAASGLAMNGAWVSAQTPTAAPQTAPPKGLAKVQADAERLKPIFRAETALDFLEATKALPGIEPRKLFHNKQTREWFTQDQASGLPADQQQALEERTLDEQYYYETRYGSPLVYARVLELANMGGAQPPMTEYPKQRVLDFGCGTVGHLRLMASLGAVAVGIDVDPLLPLLYGQPRDTGFIEPAFEPVTPKWYGWLSLYTGKWPQNGEFAGCRDGRPGTLRQTCGFNLITSKNTLKRGYISPEREADPRQLIDLGVSNEEFVKAVYDSLLPGGQFIIYNISPKLSGPDEAYKPWSDGRSPFPRELFEQAGFTVVAFDRNDDVTARAIFQAIGYPIVNTKGEDDVFALYTIVQKPVDAEMPGEP